MKLRRSRAYGDDGVARADRVFIASFACAVHIKHMIPSAPVAYMYWTVRACPRITI